MNDIFLQLKRQVPINYQGLLIYQPTFGYICDEIGLDNFNHLMLPFVISKENINIDESDMDNIDLFEDIILKDKTMLVALVTILKYFCKYDDVEFIDNGKAMSLIFNEKEPFVISKSNYEDLFEIIRKISGKEVFQVEKPPKNMSKKQREIWEKLQTGRKKDQEKNQVHIYDMLNVCEYGGNFRISQSELDQMTIWSINNCYKAIVDMKTYNDGLKIATVSGDGKSISGNNHWHHKLMIRDQ